MSSTENEKQSPKEVKEVKTLDLGGTGGMVCDFNTGICGPINEEKEEKK